MSHAMWTQRRRTMNTHHFSRLKVVGLLPQRVASDVIEVVGVALLIKLLGPHGYAILQKTERR